MKRSSRKADVCIIGSGSGGGVVAKELAERGLNVVLFEAGRRYDPIRDYTSSRPDWYTANWGGIKFEVPALNAFTFARRGTRAPLEAQGVGGSTLRYHAYAIRMGPDDFNVYSLDGVGEDWPITYEDLVPYYRKVELELGVSGKAGDPWIPQVEPYLNPPFPYSYANKIIKRGFDRLGIRLWPAPMARLSRPFDGRPICAQCGDCTNGCMSGAKSSIDVTYIAKAEATGKLVLRPECIVTRVEVNSKGKARSVVYFDKDGVEREQEAEVIVVAAGALQSPRLLLNSTSNRFPNGLANSSGLVGKYFMQHLSIGTEAIFPERIDSYRGFEGGAFSLDFAKSSPANAYARGWTTDLNSGIRAPVEMAIKSSTWGTQLKNHMKQHFGHSAGIFCNAEQLPYEGNAVELDPDVRDEYGMPVPRLNLSLQDNDRLLLDAMRRKQNDILDAAGAKQVHYREFRLGASAHNYGGCRMGEDPKRSVVNSFCQSHDVPNLFIVDASCFVTIGTANPSLTIHAIASRSSKFIAEQARQNNL